MLAARLHGPRDLRVEEVAAPRDSGALVRVMATGICGSDLHAYLDARIGDSGLKAPLILGHEFAGVIEETGQRVAVDPAQPCGRCDLCQRGHPNLCRRLHFCGLFPDNGSLAEFIRVPAQTCFPVPDALSDEDAAMLEPLGVALQATDLAKIRVGDRVAVLGAGPIGLLLVQTARLAGASEVYVSDPLAWRAKFAGRFGAQRLLAGVEVDVALEAAWGGDSIEQAIEITLPGGRVVLVGIPREDRCAFTHSIARRKGLTVLFSRRMKHAYPRAIQLAVTGRVDLRSFVTHRFPLRHAAEAFDVCANYRDNVIKAIIK
ncbi:MAG TPA: alcohol dehydrogenase catalytic domain-containing protein [Verrucomicrobiae bacterium]|nr:alcohol dehydrogenase catalytic domain-containing protein [Verrucomicrobiae bacterium]